MDPNVTLADVRQARHEVQLALEGKGNLAEAAARLAEYDEALDLWLTRDGFPPDAWARPHHPSRRERNAQNRRGHELGEHLVTTLQVVLAGELPQDTAGLSDVLDGPDISGTHGLIPTDLEEL